MFNILLVEDDDERIKWFSRELIGHNLIVVKTSSEAISALKLGKFDLLFLDHDLAESHYNQLCFDGTGSEVAKFLGDDYKNNPNMVIILHSLNPSGVRTMFNYLEGRQVIAINFLKLKTLGINRTNSVVKLNE